MLRCPNSPHEVVREARGWHRTPPTHTPGAFALNDGWVRVFWQGKMLPAHAPLAQKVMG